jgi:hypothetical protein
MAVVSEIALATPVRRWAAFERQPALRGSRMPPRAGKREGAAAERGGPLQKRAAREARPPNMTGSFVLMSGRDRSMLIGAIERSGSPAYALLAQSQCDSTSTDALGFPAQRSTRASGCLNIALLTRPGMHRLRRHRGPPRRRSGCLSCGRAASCHPGSFSRLLLEP